MPRLLVFVLAVAAALAQPSYRLTEWVIDAGGTKATDIEATLISRGSFHQLTVGRAQDREGNKGWVGYWHPRQFRAFRDAAVVEITAPVGTVDTVLLVTPSARLANLGDYPATFPAWFMIDHSNGEPFYRDSILVTLGSGEILMKTFDTLHFARSGFYVVRCSVGLARDDDPTNNRQMHTIKVASRPGPSGWQPVASMPALPSSKAIKAGGWLVWLPGVGRVFAAKGNKTRDFYSYDPTTDRWQNRETIPAGPERKLPVAGATAAGDGGGQIYVTKGSCFAFWRYNAYTDSWQRLADVPAGSRRKKMKGGADAVFATKNDTGYVYVTKGGGSNEFWRYNTQTGSWDSLPSLPPGRSPKWDKGSWLCYDGSGTIYAHQGKYHQFRGFDVVGETWYSRPLTPMPTFNNNTGRNTVLKDGGSATWYNGAIYAFKGGNTLQFWRYDPESDNWTELETIPPAGNGSRLVRVKDGADITCLGDGTFLAIKGNKSVEVWRYLPANEVVRPGPVQRSGAMATGPVPSRTSIALGPNPLTGTGLQIRGQIASAGPVHCRIYDAVGNCRRISLLTSGPGWFERTIDLAELSDGTYFVVIEQGNSRLRRDRLVIVR